ncbi:MAG: type IV pilus modification protein PilV [Moraxella sp.]|nr:type IV pilus modification protein PilV [Moraxella sp.]
MLKQIHNNQQGIGMIEILVALLLLAVAVLGFSAMQMRAIKATDETLIRGDAMVAIRNIAEDMRLHPSVAQKERYRTAVSAQAGAADPAAYATAVKAVTVTNCATTACTDEQQIAYTANRAMRLAADNQMMLNAIECPTGAGTATDLRRICLIASWGATRPVIGTAANNACIAASGTYNRGSSCLVVETY